MRRFASPILLACALVSPALAQPTTSPSGAPAPTDPAKAKVVAPTPASSSIANVGDALNLTGNPGWPAKVDWLYDSPALNDATGKVLVFSFCGAKPKAMLTTCTEELNRLIALKEANPRVYFVAYVDGTKKEALKLDPIRESEGVGRGTVAFGKNVTKWIKAAKITKPTSIVIDVDGKVALVTTGSTAADLDARDQKVAALATRIKEYSFSSDGPKALKVGDKFKLTASVKLAPWLKYSAKSPTEFKVTVPKDIACDNTVLKGDQLKTSGDTMTATVTCSGPRGSYEARAQLTFGWETPSGAAGLGAESANWKFEIKP